MDIAKLPIEMVEAIVHDVVFMTLVEYVLVTAGLPVDMRLLFLRLWRGRGLRFWAWRRIFCIFLALHDIFGQSRCLNKFSLDSFLL